MGRRLLGYVAVGSTLGIVTLAHAMDSADAARGGTSIPLLGHPPSFSIERDMPPSVQVRLTREGRRALARFRALAKLEPTLAAGCTSTDFPGSLGPPAPTVTPRLFGFHVEVVVRFDRWPRSPACRPWAVIVSIRGKPTDARVGVLPWTETFQLKGPVGRAVIRLPFSATAPYQLNVTAETASGRHGKRVTVPLRCPGGGCLKGESYRNGKPVPQPVFPVRGIDRAQLEASFLLALTTVLPAPFTMRKAGCPSLRVCRATFADPLFPRQPYRVRFEIEGEQLPGCWMVRTLYVLDPLPYEDAYRGGIVPAACVSWLR